MASTPPPPAMRAHTPPTPLHGPRYDNYEPYSPRRSSRVASKRSLYSHQQPETSASKHRAIRAVTPNTSKSAHITRTSSQTFSPPTSPASPSTRTLVISPKTGGSSTRKSHRPSSHGPQSGSDTDILPSARLKPSSVDTFGMLQTPAKTPRKRAIPNSNQNGTSRILFPGRPADVDDAMPSPRKARKAKYANMFALADEADEGSSSKIPIYTDSKERVPSLDEDANNPFLSKNATKPSKRQKKSRTEREADMDQAVKNDEGMIYVFRGKKIFRKYEDGTAADDEEDLSDHGIAHQAGAAAKRRFTRSSIQPRLLFPSDEQVQAREATEADEEAETDIDVPQLSPTKKRTAEAMSPEPESVTPVKQHFQPTTPPSTGRAKRGSAKKDSTSPQISFSESVPLDDTLSVPPTSSVTHSKAKRSPFDGWARSKGGVRATSSKGTKREGEPMTNGETPKRTRSGAYT